MALVQRKWRGIISIVGGIMIHITLGTFYTFGNMSPYITSYIRERSKPSDITYAMSTWIFALEGAMLGGCMYFGGLLDKKIGARLAALIGCLIQSTGVLLTYFTIQYSFYLVLITYGLMFGVGMGLAYAPALMCAMKWFPKHKGVTSGLIVAGFGGGPFIFNQVQAAYINPENLSPVESSNGERYFNQEDILNRTPTCFLLLGVCYISLQLIGCVLMADPPQDRGPPAQEETESEKQPLLSREENEDFDPKSSGRSLEPRDAIRTRPFWTMWFTFFFNAVSLVLASALYKAYGQNFIEDDLFLALVGSFASLFNCLGRVFWGYLGDRFSFRDAMLGLCTANSALMLTLIATQEGGKLMFFIWVCAIFLSFSGNFALFPSATARSFGVENAGKTYGILFTSFATASLAGTFSGNILVGYFGWTGLFYFCAGCSAIGLVLTLTFNVKTPEGKDI